MRRWLVSVLAACAMGADIVYVTDIQIFTLLAPCAQSALSYAIADETTKTACTADQTALQKCACDANEVKKIASAVSTEIRSSCGAGATSDQQSASSVLDKYCNPDKTITFATPSVTVDAYITDLPELSYLVPCARDVVSYAAGVEGAVS